MYKKKSIRIKYQTNNLIQKEKYIFSLATIFTDSVAAVWNISAQEALYYITLI